MEYVVWQDAQAVEPIELSCCAYDFFGSWSSPIDDDTPSPLNEN